MEKIKTSKLITFFSPFLLLKVSLLFSISKRRMDEEKAISLSLIKKEKQNIACDGNFMPKKAEEVNAE